MNKHSRFTVSVGDDPEHTDLTAELYFDQIYVAMISQDSGIDTSVIHIQPSPDPIGWRFPLNEFMQALDAAKQKLWMLRRS